MMRRILLAAIVAGCARPDRPAEPASSGPSVLTSERQGQASGTPAPTDGVPGTAFPSEVGGVKFGARPAQVSELCAARGGRVESSNDQVTCTFRGDARRALGLGFPVDRLIVTLCAGTVCAVRVDAPQDSRMQISEAMVERYGAAAAVPMGASDRCDKRSSGRWLWQDLGSIALDQCQGSTILVFAQQRAGDVSTAGY